MTGRVALALLATTATLSFFGPMQSAQSAPSQQQQYNNFIASLGTSQLGVNSSFGQQIGMTTAGPITLYWKTTTQNVVNGRWQVTNKGTGTSLSSGLVTAPAPGQTAQFQIDFSKIAPQQTPDADNPAMYYVTIQPVNSASQGLAPQSNWVKIIYAKSK
jgi:hypothetical protein